MERDSTIAALTFAAASLLTAIACGGATDDAQASATQRAEPGPETSQAPSSSSSSSSSSSFVCPDPAGAAGWGHLALPDAGPDSGSLSQGIACAACSQAKCRAELDECGANCECRTVVDAVVSCVAAGGDPLACAGPAFSASPDAQILSAALIQCGQSQCPAECAQPR